MEVSHGVPLSVSAIESELGSDADRFTLSVLPSCTSTNTVLLEAGSRVGKISVVAAEEQTAGRGRNGRVWHAWPGASLTFSVGWQYAPAPHLPMGLSLAVGLALSEALEQEGVSGIQLKWPNDLLIQDEKLAGILIELVSEGAWQRAVIGIGVNIQPPQISVGQPATGVEVRGGGRVNRNVLLARLLRTLANMLDVFDEKGFAVFQTRWNARNAFSGRQIDVVDDEKAVTGTCLGVTPEGILVLATEKGKWQVMNGDVSVRKKP